MSASNDDIMTMLQSMSVRLDTIQSTVTSLTDHITSVATAVTAMRDVQAKTEAWQGQLASKMEANDPTIAELQAKTKKETSRHKLPKKEKDATMADNASTPAPPSPPTAAPSSPQDQLATHTFVAPSLASARPAPATPLSERSNAESTGRNASLSGGNAYRYFAASRQ